MAPNSTCDAVDSVERFTVFAEHNRQWCFQSATLQSR
jgi:hypothetical protein